MCNTFTNVHHINESALLLFKETALSLIYCRLRTQFKLKAFQLI